MRGTRNRSTLVALATVACAALIATVAASADDGGRKGDDHQGKNGQGEDAAKIFSAALVGSQLEDPAIHGVTYGASPGAPEPLVRERSRVGASFGVRYKIRLWTRGSCKRSARWSSGSRSRRRPSGSA